MHSSHLSTPLFPVQTSALESGAGRVGFAYFMEQGLGKTLVSLSEIADLIFQDEIDGWVVSCPNSLKGNWAAECEKHGLKIHTYVWDKVPKDLSMIKTPFLLMINYEALGAGRGEDYIERLLKRYRCGLTLDESVQIKNPHADRSKACQRLGKLAKYKRILSGAPMTQGPQDLWSQLLFIGAIDKSMLFTSFKARYCQFGGFMGKKIIGAKNEDELNRLISRHAYRALKKDHLDLPKLWTERMVQLTPTQKKHYIELHEDFYTTINSAEISPQLVITKMNKLQQISSGFVIDDEGQVHELAGGTKKLDVLLETFEETDQKIIIPAFYSHSIKKLEEATAKYKPQKIVGGMSLEEIEENKRVFNMDRECRVIILQTQSSKYGHTLIGSEEAGRCATMTFYENTFSLDDRIQIEDRNNRIGQTLPCLYIDYISSPIERAVVKALQDKRDLLAAVVDGVKKEGPKVSL